MKIATAKTKTSKRWRTTDWTWAQILRKLSEPYRTTETAAEYRRMTKEEKDFRKAAAGGFVGGALTSGQRKTEFVASRTLITLDSDHASRQMWDRVVCLQEFCMACYSTHSSTPSSPRLRWIIPTDRPMTPEEYQPVARMVASWLDIETMDPSTYELARLMYWPTCSADAEYEFHQQNGPVLCVDDVLAEYGKGEAWKDCTLWPISSLETDVMKKEVRVAGNPQDKPGLIGVFCREYDIYSVIDEFLSDTYEATDKPNRYTYVKGTSFGGASVVDNGNFLYSFHATDPACGHCVNAFDLVRIHKFGEMDEAAAPNTTVTKLPSYKQMCKFASELPSIKAAVEKEASEKADAAFADMTGSSAQAESSEKDWHEKLELDDKGTPVASIGNAQLYLRNLPAFKGKLRYNTMSSEIRIDGTLPWRTKKTDNYLSLAVDIAEAEDNSPRDSTLLWEDTDYAQLYAYMESYGFKTTGKNNGVLDNALLNVANDRAYHPIRDYLMSLTWDGTERLDTILIRWLGAEDCRLNRVVTRRWMLGAVDRVMRPGCQFEQVLTLIGGQGIGKTKFLRTVFRGFYCNSIGKAEMEKSVAEKLQGSWVVDFDELRSVKRSDIESFKTFVSATSDKYRGAYTRVAVDRPRQCVIAATTNEVAFLRDVTGERRFWLVPVAGIGDDGVQKGLAEEVDQIWAEAFAAWQKLFRENYVSGTPLLRVNLCLYLKEKDLASEMNRRCEEHKLPDDLKDDIENYLDRPRPSNWYDLDVYERQQFAQGNWIGDESTCTLTVNHISSKELRYELFGERVNDVATKNSKSLSITTVMNAMPGWRSGRRITDKAYRSRLKCWVRIGSEEDTSDGEA